MSRTGPFARRYPLSYPRPCSLSETSPERTASISLEIPGIELQVHDCTDHSLRETAVKVTVEALHTRDHEARREILGDIGVGTHAESATTVVCESALAGH